MIPDWQLDLRELGYAGEFDYKWMRARIEARGWRFESLVQMPVRKDPDWPNWVARASVGYEGYSGAGMTDLEALGKLLAQILAKR